VRIEAGELTVSNNVFINSLSQTPFVLSTTGDATLTIGSSVSAFQGLGVAGISGGGIVQPGATVGTLTTFSSVGGGGSFSGSLRDHGAAILELGINGTGTQELTGANFFTGSTTVSHGTLALAGNGTALNTEIRVSGGTLLLDNSAVAITDRISDTKPVSLLAGAIVFQGSRVIPSAETAGRLTLGNAAVSVAVQPDPRSQPH